MTQAIKKYWAFVAVIVLSALIALVVTITVLQRQRVAFPKWMPGIGTDYVSFKADLATAQAVMPGQGQPVTFSGVDVGDITAVNLEQGHAVVTFRVRRKYAKMMRSTASALLRPKTGLADMALEIDPGAGGRPVEENFTISLANSNANVNVDEILASLDRDTRDSLQLLLNGFAEGVNGQSKRLAAAIQKFPPVTRNLKRIGVALEDRDANVKRTVHSLRQVTETLANSRGDLVKAVDTANDVFGTVAKQNTNLRASLQQLPGTLQQTQRAVNGLQQTAEALKPTTAALEPVAKQLAPALKASQPFLKQTEPVLRKQLLPFATDTRGTIKRLGIAARKTVDGTPNLQTTVKNINTLGNIMAYDPPGEEQGYLFWLQWASHIIPTLFSVQDANGVSRRVMGTFGCSSIVRMAELAEVNPAVQLLNDIITPLDKAGYCPRGNEVNPNETNTSSDLVKKGAGK